jgi:hypothetical protein
VRDTGVERQPAPAPEVAENSETDSPPDGPADTTEPVSAAASPQSAAPLAAGVPVASTEPPSLAENVKTLLAGIGLFFILFHTLRLLSIAQGGRRTS